MVRKESSDMIAMIGKTGLTTSVAGPREKFCLTSKSAFSRSIILVNNNQARGHLNSIFGGICMKIADLVRIQVTAVKFMTKAYPKVYSHIYKTPEMTAIADYFQLGCPTCWWLRRE